MVVKFKFHVIEDVFELIDGFSILHTKFGLFDFTKELRPNRRYYYTSGKIKKRQILTIMCG